MEENFRKKILVIGLAILFQLILFSFITTSNAVTTGTVVAWDVSAQEGAGAVIATLYSNGEFVISGTGTMRDYVSSEERPYYDEISAIKTVKIESGVTSIGDIALYCCTNLTNIEISDTVTSIGNAAMSGCTSLTSIKIPDGVTSIGKYAFSGCTSLTSVEIPDSVRTIEAKAFYCCTSLASIEIPSGIENIGENVFNGCTKLEAINVSENSSYYCSENGILFNKDKTELIRYPEGNKETTYEIPNSVTSIGECAFKDCTNLTSIKIPDKVISIGDSTFSGCKNLTSIDIPDSVMSIGEGAFSSCVGLTSIEIPDKVNAIWNYTFMNCYGLTSIKIPDSVIAIEVRAFYNCTNLSNIEISNELISIGEGAFHNCAKLTNIEIPDSVITIGANAFKNCTGLTNIEISENLGIIDYGVFSDCTSLTNIKIPDSVTAIYETAFSGCTSLKDIEISTNIVKIYDAAFLGCTSLSTIEIPDSVVFIGSQAFSGCEKLEKVYIPDSVTDIYDDVFSGCTSLVIYCKSDSTAKKYAEEKSIKYITEDILPVITKITASPEVWKNNNVTLKIEASDETVGLATKSYSFDGGKTWQSENIKVCTITVGNEVDIRVKDKVGNVQIYKYTPGLLMENLPWKKTYVEGQSFRTDGMKVVAVSNDGTKKELEELSDDIDYGYEIINGDSLELGQETVIIRYTENGITDEIEQKITVVKKELASIIAKEPNVTKYVEGDDFNKKGMVVTAAYNDGTTKEIPVDNCIVTNGESLKEGQTSVTISYTEDGITKETQQEITVVKKVLTGFGISKSATKQDYIEGEKFDTTGMVAIAVFSSAVSREVTDYKILDGTNVQLGQTKVTISYTVNGVTKTAEQAITVAEKKLTGISIEQAPSKTAYIEGEKFDTTGMKVVATYNDGNTKEISDSEYIVEFGDSLSLGQVSVVISYTEDGVTKTAEQAITVTKRETLEITLGNYKEETDQGNSYLESIKPNTKISELVSNIQTNGNIEIYKGTTQITNEDTILTTGMKIKISLNEQEKNYIVVVTGDLNGDGQIGNSDLLRIVKYNAELDKNLEGAYLRAADIYKDGKYADNKDLLKMARVLVELESL